MNLSIVKYCINDGNEDISRYRVIRTSTYIYIKCRIIHIASLSTIFIPYIVVTWKEKVVYRLPETPRTKT